MGPQHRQTGVISHDNMQAITTWVCRTLTQCGLARPIYSSVLLNMIQVELINMRN